MSAVRRSELPTREASQDSFEDLGLHRRRTLAQDLDEALAGSPVVFVGVIIEIKFEIKFMVASIQEVTQVAPRYADVLRYDFADLRLLKGTAGPSGWMHWRLQSKFDRNEPNRRSEFGQHFGDLPEGLPIDWMVLPTAEFLVLLQRYDSVQHREFIIEMVRRISNPERYRS
jgi:hypothetical protein